MKFVEANILATHRARFGPLMHVRSRARGVSASFSFGQSVIRASLDRRHTLPLFFNSDGHGFNRVPSSSNIHSDPFASIVLRYLSHSAGAEDQEVSTPQLGRAQRTTTDMKGGAVTRC